MACFLPAGHDALVLADDASAIHEEQETIQSSSPTSSPNKEVVAFEQFEYSKENIQPQRKGRDPKKLLEALQNAEKTNDKQLGKLANI